MSYTAAWVGQRCPGWPGGCQCPPGPMWPEAERLAAVRRVRFKRAHRRMLAGWLRGLRGLRVPE